jgi:hypothetical protein
MGMSFQDFHEMAAALALRASDRHNVAGLTELELAELEQALGGGSLPRAYRDFMTNMGKDAGPLLAGTDVFYPSIVEFQTDAWGLVSEEGISHLIPAGSLVFAIHQGYQIYWMPAAAGEDPPVFIYQEGDREICAQWGSFSEFISDEFFRIC